MQAINKPRQLAILSICGIAFLTEAPAAVNPNEQSARDEQAQLTSNGRQLEAKYTSMLEQVVNDIQSSLPPVNDANIAASIAAIKTLAEATNHLNSAENNLVGNQRTITGHSVEVAQNDVKVAPVILNARKDMLEWAKSLPDSHEDKADHIEFAERHIQNRTRDLENAPRSLERAQDQYEKAKAEESQIKADYQAALAAYEQALAEARKALDATISTGNIISSNSLDGKLAAFKILSDATPGDLARFAQQSTQHERLLEQLFSSPSLMLQMVAADGAAGGKYGEATEIYAAIQKASPRASEGLFQRMALATSLIFATPMEQENNVADKDAPEFVDPVQRYLSYEKWFLEGELDPAFEDLRTWDLKMAMNQNTPNEILAWGREMLRSYRPDLIEIDHKHGRYIASVNTEISFGSGDVPLDRDDRNRYHNILANGGICGRRAYFGRFILRCFGIPAIPRPEPGHATTAYWTPDGWQTRLGGNWGGRSWIHHNGEQTHNRNFLAITQARENEEGYLQVQRAQWIGDVMEEERAHGLHGRGGRQSSRENPVFEEKIGPWYATALVRQSELIHELRTQAQEAGEHFNYASTFGDYIDHPEYDVSNADREIVVNSDGVITIPAAAAELPEINLARSGEMSSHITLRFMESNLGGVQLHYGRYSLGTPFTFTVDVPQAGRYALTSRLITPRPNEALTISVNNAPRVDMPLPYTTGLWGASEPITLELEQGENNLSFLLSYDSTKGVTIRDFTLTPVN